MGAVIITKSPSVLVKPASSELAVTELINLSSYDKPNVGFPVTALFVFDQEIDDPAEAIKRGLSKALLYYYPLSGRLAAGATAGEVVVECNGEGVPFVVASADCAVNDVHELRDPSLKEKLAIFYPGRVPGLLHTDPLLMMQVTVFSCGGFVVGLTWDHSIADGTGIGQFMQAVGELSRGLPSPSVIPVSRSDESLIGAPQAALGMLSLLRSLVPSPLVLLDIRVPWSLIDRIKRDFSSSSEPSSAGEKKKRLCSVFEAVTAVVWQCRTRAVMEEEEEEEEEDDDPEAPTVAMLFFVANTRRYARAKDGYYGNCGTVALVRTTSSLVAKGDIMDVIRMIQHAKDQIPGQYRYSNVDGDELGGNKSRLTIGYKNVCCMTSWRNLGLEKADFGGGRPARVTAHTKSRMGIPVCVSCLPWKEKDDSEFFSLMSLCVKEEHAGAFLRHLENFT